MSSERDLARLGRALKTLRMQRYPSRLAAANAAGVSKDTWQKIEDGEPARDVSYAKIEKALGLAPDSWIEIAEGREPFPLQTPDTPEGQFATIPMGALLAELEQAHTDATIATIPDATARQIKAARETFIEVLRERGILPSASQ